MNQKIKTLKVTKAQINAINVLNELGGWTTHNQMHKHGALSNAANALVKYGYVEVRKLICNRGYEFSEWRSTYKNITNPLEEV